MDAGLGASPGAAPLLAQRAVFRLIGGEPEGAVEDLRAALASDPDFLEARDRLWQLLMQMDRAAESAVVLREGLARPDAPVVLRAHLAQVLFMGGDLSGAASEARARAQ